MDAPLEGTGLFEQDCLVSEELRVGRARELSEHKAWGQMSWGAQ